MSLVSELHVTSPGVATKKALAGNPWRQSRRWLFNNTKRSRATSRPGKRGGGLVVSFHDSPDPREAWLCFQFDRKGTLVGQQHGGRAGIVFEEPAPQRVRSKKR